MPLKITCQKDGFWRGGKQHFKTAKIWPDDAFTKEERKQVMEEPLLHVVVVKGSEPESDKNKNKKKEALS